MHNYAYFRISVEKIWTSLWIETLVPQTYFYAWLSLSRRGQCRSNSGTKRRHNNAKKKQSLGGAESLKVAGSDNIHDLCCRSVYADKDLKYFKKPSKWTFLFCLWGILLCIVREGHRCRGTGGNV